MFEDLVSNKGFEGKNLGEEKGTAYNAKFSS